MKTDSNSAIKQIVGKARSVPFSGYLLILINAIMIAAFVCQDMTMHYLLGMIVFYGRHRGCLGWPNRYVHSPHLTDWLIHIKKNQITGIKVPVVLQNPRSQ
jgi:hypothetical protein